MSTLTLAKRSRARSLQGSMAYEKVLELADGPIDPDLVRRHENLFWLCREMERLSEDVIDREICKRLRQIAGRVDEDLSDGVMPLFRSREEQDLPAGQLPEAILPFYRHYRFMLKRRARA